MKYKLLDIPKVGTGRSPHGERGLKYDGMDGLAAGIDRRSPHGERGLKCPCSSPSKINDGRSPHGERGLKQPAQGLYEYLAEIGNPDIVYADDMEGIKAFLSPAWTAFAAGGAAAKPGSGHEKGRCRNRCLKPASGFEIIAFLPNGNRIIPQFLQTLPLE